MDMKLFDTGERNYTGTKRYTESSYSYMNRSAQDAAYKIRGVVEDWFNCYPEDEKAEFQRRFQSDEDTSYNAAFFELYIHELLLRLGYEIELHPQTGNDLQSRPDFLVKSPTGCFYLEATTSECKSKEEIASERRFHVVLDMIEDRLYSRDFKIGIEYKDFPKTTLAAKKICAFIDNHLKGLDLQKIEEIFDEEKHDLIPKWTYEQDGWKLKISPYPKIPDDIGKNENHLISTVYRDMHIVNTGEHIKNSLLSKANKYGKLEYPFVIAINALKWNTKYDDFIDAFFGRNVYKLDLFSEPKVVGVGRDLRGVLTQLSGPRYTRISAVLGGININPVEIPRSKLRLFLNPFAEKQIGEELVQLPRAFLSENKIVYSEGVTDISEIFSLPVDWPGY